MYGFGMATCTVSPFQVYRTSTACLLRDLEFFTVCRNELS